MISTNKIRVGITPLDSKAYLTGISDAPQKLRVLTTNKVKPKTEEDMLASAKAQVEALKPLVHPRDTRKYEGPMLTTVNMEDKRLNEKRKMLTAKMKSWLNPVPEEAELVLEKKQRGRPKKT